jgi:hypothetical protein
MATTQRIASRCEILFKVDELFFPVLAFYSAMCWGRTIINLYFQAFETFRSDAYIINPPLCRSQTI